MADNKRVDLGGDLDQLLQDVKAATDEVKQRQDADKVKDARDAKKEQSRKISGLIIAVAAVVIVVIAYFAVFAKPEQGVPLPSTKRVPAPPIKINTTQTKPASPVRGVPVVPTVTTNQGRRSGTLTNRPPNDYEQPGGRGM